MFEIGRTVIRNMIGRCYQCKEQRELEPISYETFRLGIPWLTSLFQHEVAYACAVCGKQVSERIWLDGTSHKTMPGFTRRTDGNIVERKYARISGHRISGDRWVSLQYPGAMRADEGILYPTFEGNIQDATVIDRYGDPDLMADFAEEYLRQFWILMPEGKLPSTLKEIMPGLLLLFAATEIALKAYWIRSEQPLKRNHSLTELYEQLASEHKAEIFRRFGELSVNPRLSGMGIEVPSVEHILERYSHTYGVGNSVHTDSRYYAEPTTMFSPKNDLHGSNLVKGNTPYPIFLPYLVQASIDAYRFFTGPERLRRLGADLRSDHRSSSDGDHGKWRLVPSSLGMVVVVVSQRSAKDDRYEDLPKFRELKKSNPTEFCVDWMYGGSTLLFYRDDGQPFPDGQTEINGVQCTLRSREILGMHARDLYALADALENSARGSDVFGHLTLSTSNQAVDE